MSIFENELGEASKEITYFGTELKFPNLCKIVRQITELGLLVGHTLLWSGDVPKLIGVTTYFQDVNFTQTVIKELEKLKEIKDGVDSSAIKVVRCNPFSSEDTG